MQSEKAFQDLYPDEFSHCYGCGRLNPHGHRIKSHWDGDESVAFFTPEPHHMAVPGFVYGGLIASLIDCHCVGTAAAAVSRQNPQEAVEDLRFVTASLKVNYLAPTPLGPPLEIRGIIQEVGERRVTVEAKLLA
ncbi:MAG: PaaI family thioesterase, partial [Desulfobacterales bacterium]|nr:PaaI family thioesterase [Desulfobacterales bacterium]